MGQFYDQLALVWKGEAPIDSVPATMLEFNVHKAAERVMSLRKQFRAHAMDHDYHPQIGDLIRARILELHARYLAQRKAQEEPVQKVKVHNPEWNDWV